MAILNLLGAKAHLNASHVGAHYRCSPRTPFTALTFLARDGHLSEYPTTQPSEGSLSWHGPNDGQRRTRLCFNLLHHEPLQPGSIPRHFRRRDIPDGSATILK